jgi:hypothetical protein
METQEITEVLTCNPEAYDIPNEGSPLSRWRQTRKALQYHLEMAGKNVAYIKAPKGELRRIIDNFPDGLMRFEVHFRD